MTEELALWRLGRVGEGGSDSDIEGDSEEEVVDEVDEERSECEEEVGIVLLLSLCVCPLRSLYFYFRLFSIDTFFSLLTHPLYHPAID
jgi:hypothetical protein